MTAAGGAGGAKESVKQYYQRSRGDWKKSLRRSWDLKIKNEEALFASPDERTRAQSELLQLDYAKTIRRLRKFDPKLDVGFSVSHEVAELIAAYVRVGGKESDLNK